MLLFVVAYERAININLVLLIGVVAVGNGGYYALSVSRNLEEAILANSISYVIGIFAPAILFFIICGICRIEVPKIISTHLYLVQVVIFLSACTVGRYDIFYRTVNFHRGTMGAYLTKTYGPMHTAYLVSMLLYSTANIVVGMYSLSRKSIVSRINVDLILFLDMLVVGVYLIERFLHLKFELLPVFLTIAIMIILIPLVKISLYSVYSNIEIFQDRIKGTGYIFFNKKMKYMGCSEYASVLFPELLNWELERNIPGNGGRFNTFLRQPLLEYAKEKSAGESQSNTFSYKGAVYSYDIRALAHKKIIYGYMIQISNVTDVVTTTNKME